MDTIDVRQVKIAGPFLDGCGVSNKYIELFFNLLYAIGFQIYLAGFGAEQREKLCKILNFSGATRYDDINERVTHVLVGDSSCHDLKLMMSKGTLKSSPIVNIHWLINSINGRHPADEQNYLVNTITSSADEPSSPLSKKVIKYLLHEDSQTHFNNLNNLLECTLNTQKFCYSCCGKTGR